MSNIYLSKYARRSRHHHRPAWRSRTPLRYLLIIAIGVLLVIGATMAYAAVILHGRGTLQAPAMQQQPNLQVSDVHLSRALTPGAAADLLFSVRNPNAFAVRVDKVTLVAGLRKAKPAGCISKVAGPVTKPAGYRLPPAEHVLVGAGVKQNVVVHAAFTLARTAKTGCGFTAEVDVSATQQTPTASPTTVNPTTAPASTHPADPTTNPTTTPATVDPTIPTTSTLQPPGIPPSMNCDLADLFCESGLHGL